MRTFLFTFIIAFALNGAWEFAHSVLYVSYQSGAISTFVLLRAALFDATVISLFSFPFLRCEPLQNRPWLFASLLVLFAIGLEEWALATHRWVYAEAMPLIPFLEIGLTPAIQLALTGYLSLRIVEKIRGMDVS